jgi:hypothetical protein
VTRGLITPAETFAAQDVAAIMADRKQRGIRMLVDGSPMDVVITNAQLCLGHLKHQPRNTVRWRKEAAADGMVYFTAHRV